MNNTSDKLSRTGWWWWWYMEIRRENLEIKQKYTIIKKFKIKNILYV